MSNKKNAWSWWFLSKSCPLTKKSFMIDYPGISNYKSYFEILEPLFFILERSERLIWCSERFDLVSIATYRKWDSVMNIYEISECSFWSFEGFFMRISCIMLLFWAPVIKRSFFSFSVSSWSCSNILITQMLKESSYFWLSDGKATYGHWISNFPEIPL